MPRGTVGFALWARQLSPTPLTQLHIPSRSPSGVMIEFPVLELYLAARLVYLLGLITAPGKGKGGWRCGGVVRYRQTDKSYILISCSLFTLI